MNCVKKSPLALKPSVKVLMFTFNIRAEANEFKQVVVATCLTMTINSFENLRVQILPPPKQHPDTLKPHEPMPGVLHPPDAILTGYQYGTETGH